MDKKRHFLPFLILIALTPLMAMSAETNSVSTVDDVAANTAGNIVITLVADKYSEQLSPDLLDSWVSYSNAYSLSLESRSEFENTEYCPVNKIFCALTLTDIRRQSMHLSPQTIIKNDVIRSYLEDLARKINRDPVDAKFSIENGKVTTFSEGSDGIALNMEKSMESILEILKNPGSDQDSKTITLAVDTKKPTVGYADANNLGISSLIGQGTSDFKGSPINRIFNIKVATERFNGVLIKPGEEFSFVKILGEVDADHGYRPELVIKNNQTTPEFGGGICQVSTTTFRAAIYSGLKITARRNHAYPVSYYNPQGMDATVYVPSPDLRFINNTPNHILIQTRIEGTKLIFDFYGTDDGRKIVVDGPKITERQPDGSLKATFSQHVFNSAGEEIISDVFNSAYNSPYNYPHPGGPVLTAKPANWSKDQWKAYQQTQKDIAKAASKKP